MGKGSALLNVSRLIEESVREEVSVETSFSEDLKRCIEKLSVRDSKPSPFYKPSSLSCIRNMYYQRTSAELDASGMSADLFGICESGTDRHLRIQNYISSMRKYGIDCDYVKVSDYLAEHDLPDLEIVEEHDYETKLFNKRYNLRFLADGLIRYKGKYYLLEIKTESYSKWMMRGGVDPHHYNQAFAYSLSFGIPEVMFIYENRDCCAKKCYKLDVTDENRQMVANKIDTCESYAVKHIVPDKPVDIDRKTCTYCEYRTQCRKDG